MSSRIEASGDVAVGVFWTLFVVILVVVIVAIALALRRYNRSRAGLRHEGLGPVSAGAAFLGGYTPEKDAPSTPADVDERLREITELHDRGVLDDAEYERQRARMLEP